MNARLLSVNVGLPRDIEWRGRKVFTGIWKSPVPGRCRVHRLNLDGDAQGDLAGHGGVYRAVFVYQIESYRYWQDQLGRTDFIHGQFGENFTIEGLPDDTVCIGDRYRIGTALFEVTQPRVTCYRVGIRMNEPRMPALLTSSGRPGFYFRVMEEGEVGAGDEIVKVSEATERMTVTEINALLYSPDHAHERIERALRVQALSPGWRASFQAMLQSRMSSGNAGLIPAVAAHPAAPGFHRLVVTGMARESLDVVSLTLRRADGGPLQPAVPGQYVVVQFRSTRVGRAFFRSYSLSGDSSAESYRISVKIEPDGAAGAELREHIHPGDALDVSSPRGSFILQSGDGPLLLLSAGIGVTPVLAMLHALASARSPRRILWLHAARDGEHHPFATEVRGLLGELGNARAYVCYSRPAPSDRVGKDFDASGHLSKSVLDGLEVPKETEVYLCGPNSFMADMKTTLATLGIAPERIYAEIFGGGESMTPGVVGGTTRAPHPPQSQNVGGVLVSFARSGLAVHWDASAYRNILELAEACDVPVRWSCRAGVCHNCESGLVSGTVVYAPDPLDRPAEGNVLVCCSQPAADVVIDL